MTIKILVDSTSDIPEDLIKKHDINVVPLTVNFEDKSYLDKVDISNEEFFEKLKSCDKLPTTSQASPSAFMDSFSELTKNGDDVIAILISTNFSGTYESARIAKNMMDECSEKVHLVDSNTASLGACLLVLEACRLVEDGLSIEDILAELDKRKKKINILAGVDTLKYLEKGGRMTKGLATVGTILNIKPIISVKNGEIAPIDKVRGSNKIIKWIESNISENENIEKEMIAVYHSVNNQVCDKLENIVKNTINPNRIIRGDIGSVIGTHTGPGAIAIAYFEK